MALAFVSGAVSLDLTARRRAGLSARPLRGNPPSGGLWTRSIDDVCGRRRSTGARNPRRVCMVVVDGKRPEPQTEPRPEAPSTPPSPPVSSESNSEDGVNEQLQQNFDEQLYERDATKPGSMFAVGGRYFMRELGGIAQQIHAMMPGGKERTQQRLPDCLKLTLDDEKVRQRELAREAAEPLFDRSPLVSRVVYATICRLLDVFFGGRPIQRFWFLETVARMPYFAILSVLHLYETFGWWRVSELRQVHFAEDWNELHHLLIMEALGGNSRWTDRFLASHSAIFYYWVLVLTFVISPSTSYNFSELLENHAVDTYEQFFEENKETLLKLPAPPVARRYYRDGDLYLFDEFQTQRPVESRRPKCDNLYDVFENIRDDEIEHVKTMEACSDYTRLGMFVQSPHERHLREKNKKFLEVTYTQVMKSIDDGDDGVAEPQSRISAPGESSVLASTPVERIEDEPKEYEDGMGL